MVRGPVSGPPDTVAHVLLWRKRKSPGPASWAIPGGNGGWWGLIMRWMNGEVVEVDKGEGGGNDDREIGE